MTCNEGKKCDYCGRPLWDSPPYESVIGTNRLLDQILVELKEIRKGLRETIYTVDVTPSK